MTGDIRRRTPAGAEVVPAGTHFRVWAPDHKRIEVVFKDRDPLELEREKDGYFSGFGKGIGAGALYRFRLNGDKVLPDPASRFQPGGPHDWSEVIDPDPFAWTDSAWRGPEPESAIIYELHVGTFTPEGTFRAAMEKLPWLRDTGITVIEIMPINEFSGRFGWGYDGVYWYAPTRLYGRPDELREFVNRAHALGLAVILDVVYNHLGPDGNYLTQFAKDFFNSGRDTEWGPAINYDGPNSGPVRQFVTGNAAYWISEFHLDGLRLDATQSIHDDSARHIIAELACAARRAAGERRIVLVGENEPQQVKLIRPPEQGGYGLDMLWNDDQHHSALVAITGRNEAYYTDYLGTPQEFISAAKYGFLFQGQWYEWQNARRGTASLRTPPHALVTFTQNHDQVANSSSGDRCVKLTDPGRLRAVTAATVLMPGTPMLFQGQEFGATTPFFYFADHEGELGELVRNGRTEFMLQFATVGTPEMRGCLPDPSARETFERCKLDWTEVERNGPLVRFHRDLLHLRREDPTLRSPASGSVDGAVLGPEAFLLRWFGESPQQDRLLLVNLGRDLPVRPAPEPLLAPPQDMEWQILWSTEHPQYGGCGTVEPESDENWRLPGHAAILMQPGTPRRPRQGKRSRESIVRERNLAASGLPTTKAKNK